MTDRTTPEERAGMADPESRIGRIVRAAVRVWLVEMVGDDDEPVEWVLSVRDGAGGETAWMSLTREQFTRLTGGASRD